MPKPTTANELLQITDNRDRRENTLHEKNILDKAVVWKEMVEWNAFEFVSKHFSSILKLEDPMMFERVQVVFKGTVYHVSRTGITLFKIV